MVLDGMTATAVRRGLPPIDTYLRSVIAVGMGSLRLALPALGFLYFYRLGMGLYLALSGDSSGPFGGYDERTLIVTGAMQIVAYLPMLVLIYSPFLPLQDSLLRGQRLTFGGAVRIVLERLAPFIVSVIAQLALLFGPPAILFSGAAVLAGAMPQRPEGLVRLLALATVGGSVLYILILGLFLVFALPAVVLDRRGPLASIRLSFEIVGRRFGGVVGRLFVALVLLVIAAVAGSLPEAFLDAAAADVQHPAFKIAGAIWGAAVSAFLFPFTVAALVVLYRAAVPAAAGPGTSSPAPGEQASPTQSPFRFE